MKINFVFPDVPRKISGGLKIVFEYANRLVERGYDVGIVFDCAVGIHQNRKFVPVCVKNILYPFFVKYYPRWIRVNPKVRKICSKTGINNKEVPDGDVVIATAVKTAAPVAKLSASKGRKMYFIQGFENWTSEWTEERVKKTYHLGLTNIVVAKWLENILKKDEASCVLIPNGIDFNVFNIDKPIRSRNKHTISMLYHIQPLKGSKYGIQALIKLKRRYPDLQAHLFGVPPRPEDLPDWIFYTRNATQEQLRRIYNWSLIYLYPSIAESFGLTGAEAMACGAAYVASDYGGVHEYAKDNRNVLLSSPKDVDELVQHVSYLFDHDKQRIRLAENGYKDIQNFGWEKSLDKFEKVLQSKI